MSLKVADLYMIIGFLALLLIIAAVEWVFPLGGRYITHNTGRSDFFVVDRFTGEVVRQCDFDGCKPVRGGRAKVTP